MASIRVIHARTNQVIGEEVDLACSFWKRFRGLMFTSHLPADKGLYLQPCPSIHTFFMKYPIDVIYLNKQHVIVGLDENLRPNTIGSKYPASFSVIELPAGKIKSTALQTGEQLVLETAEVS